MPLLSAGVIRACAHVVSECVELKSLAPTARRRHTSKVLVPEPCMSTSATVSEDLNGGKRVPFGFRNWVKFLDSKKYISETIWLIMEIFVVTVLHVYYMSPRIG